MEDLKSLGDKPELKLGNKEVAFLVGSMFIVMVVVFGLGVMVGKRLYSQPPVPVAATVPPMQPAPAAPVVTAPEAPEARPEPAPATTGEDYTFYNLKKQEPPAEAPAEKPKKSAAPRAETETPTTKKTTEATPSEPVSASRPPSNGWKWTIQVGAFLKRENSERGVKRLRNKGVEAWVQRVAPKTIGNVYYAICIGKYKSFDKAKEDLENMKAAGLIPEDSYVRGRKR